MNSIVIQVASPEHLKYSESISALYEESAKQRGIGIAMRSQAYIENKINEGKAIIAISGKDRLVGFCYIESWGNKEYVANSGLIIHPDFRGSGIAKKIKKRVFNHSREMFPEAKVFGLTTSLPVMKMNSDLGYRPVTYNQLTADEEFWKGCKSCVNYEILMSKNRTNCLCTAMLHDSHLVKKNKWDFFRKSRLYARLEKMKNKGRIMDIKVL